jgi:hypothetical protein
VNQHPDRDTLSAFREHRLSGTDVIAVAGHLAQCDECSRDDGRAAQLFLSAVASRNADAHLSDEELDLLIDEGDATEHRTLTRHLSACAMCRDELADLRALDEESHARVVPLVRSAPSRGVPYWVAAAALLILIAGGSYFFRRQTPEAPAHTTIVATQTAAPVAASKPIAQPSVTIADHGQNISLLSDGTIVGVALRSAEEASIVRAALERQSIPLLPFAGAATTLRSGSNTMSPMHVVRPYRSSVATARPRFEWTAVPNARSYRVAVFDEQFEEVTHSDALTSTTWTPAKPLPSGTDLSWHVTADTPDGEVSSANAGTAEALFRVLDANETAALNRELALHEDSNLLRGLIYVRHGLVHDAEREFQELAAQNPSSPVAANLLKTLRKR